MKTSSIRTTLLRFSLPISLVIFTSMQIKGEIAITGCSLHPIKILPPEETGLSFIYVLNDLSNAYINYDTDDPNSVKIYSFSEYGIDAKTPCENIEIYDNKITLKLLNNSLGYIIENKGKKNYIWVINYSDNNYEISSIKLSIDNNCDSTDLNIIGSADPIIYYDINGKPNILSREIILSYNTLIFDNNSHQFIETKIEKDLASIDTSLNIVPPLLSPTTVTIEGDRFLKEWDKYKVIESDIISPVSTMVYTETIQENISENSQISNNDNKEFGGSAPLKISFLAWVSDATVHTEWQISDDINFDNIQYRINKQDFQYDFTSQGTVYVRFIGSNKDGTCSSFGDIYTITIDSPELVIPNAFSPNGDGINDIWKISYKSLIDFKCWIFDRHGHEIYHFSEPELGWDGKIRGRDISSGVYYYIIEAIGSDGKKIRKKGDINVIKSKR